MDQMEITKMFIFTYAIFSILLNLFGIAHNVEYTPIETSGQMTLASVVDFFGQIFYFLFNLLLFTTDYAIINIILWAFRAVALMELLIYGKRVLNPVAN